MVTAVSSSRPGASMRRILIPLALAQFICSFAGSNMNVMINDISEDLDTTVQGVAPSRRPPRPRMSSGWPNSRTAEVHAARR
jgi:hypothetical protein